MSDLILNLRLAGTQLHICPEGAYNGPEYGIRRFKYHDTLGDNTMVFKEVHAGSHAGLVVVVRQISTLKLNVTTKQIDNDDVEMAFYFKESGLIFQKRCRDLSLNASVSVMSFGCN